MNVITILSDARKAVTALLAVEAMAVSIGVVGHTTDAEIVGAGGLVTSTLVWAITNVPKYTAELRKITPETWWKPPAQPAPLVTGTAAPHPSPYPHATQGETR